MIDPDHHLHRRLARSIIRAASHLAHLTTHHTNPTHHMSLITLEDAVHALRIVEAEVAPLGWHAALGGSTIVQGHSVKDIDIILYPHCAELATDITSSWHALVVSHRCNSTYRDKKPVYVAQPHQVHPDIHHRIDFFVLGPDYVNS